MELSEIAIEQHENSKKRWIRGGIAIFFMLLISLVYLNYFAETVTQTSSSVTTVTSPSVQQETLNKTELSRKSTRDMVPALPTTDVISKPVPTPNPGSEPVLITDREPYPQFSAQATLYMFGVYAGQRTQAKKTTRRKNHREGVVQVEVPNPGHPIILVLSAYEPVHWQLRFPQGNTVEHIILSGYYQQRISGVPTDIPVIEYSPVTGQRNRFFAYKRQDKNYRKAANILLEMTHKPISGFRGDYRTGEFHLSPIENSNTSSWTK